MNRGDEEQPPGTWSAAGGASDGLAARLAFLQITEADCQRVREMAPRFLASAAVFVERFYHHLLAFPATAVFLQDPALVERLKGLQLQYFQSLVRAELGPGFVAHRQRIGQAHAAVGIEPQWFLGAFCQYVQQCFAAMPAPDEPDGPAYLAAVQSLLKLIMLDVGLTLDAYWSSSTEKLRKALDLYAQSNTELAEFANLVAHDLKTPLATVAALCDEFLDEFGKSVPAEARGLIEAAHKRTLQTKGMIDDLLAVSRAAAEPTQRGRVATRAMLDEVIDRVRQEIGQRSITLVVPDQLPDVYGHAGRLREVFYHLLSNAVKFMEREPGFVRVSAEVVGPQCVYCVSDTGPGIPPQECERIFAPFHRRPEHRHLPGSGLGLYFVRKIVEEQGGGIRVESGVNEGSRFYVTLPAAGAVTAAGHPRSPDRASPAADTGGAG